MLLTASLRECAGVFGLLVTIWFFVNSIILDGHQTGGENRLVMRRHLETYAAAAFGVGSGVMVRLSGGDPRGPFGAWPYLKKLKTDTANSPKEVHWWRGAPSEDL